MSPGANPLVQVGRQVVRPVAIQPAAQLQLRRLALVLLGDDFHGQGFFAFPASLFW